MTSVMITMHVGMRAALLLGALHECSSATAKSNA
jgi:hypothetical protein